MQCNTTSGSYGSPPLPVLSSCAKLTREIELNPDLFQRIAFQPPLIQARERIAHLIGAAVDECVLVPNASHGLATVLRNIEWNAGDAIVVNSITYSSISLTAKYLSDIPPHPTISSVPLRLPCTHASIITTFRAHIRSITRTAASSQAGNSPPRKVVAIIDSIASNPGVLLPWGDLVRVCREEGVWSIVDAAHSIGQEVGIDLGSVQPDFWVSNCYKWLSTKLGCAVLYVPKRNQNVIKSTIPTSHGYTTDDPDFVWQFLWTGAHDWVPYLSINFALDFRAWIGGETKINTYCHGLALAGGKRIAEVMSTELMEHPDQPGELVANMINAALPISPEIPDDLVVIRRFQHLLLKSPKWKVYGAHFKHAGRWWVRCSAQIWNELADFEKLGYAMVDVCKQIEREFGRVDGAGEVVLEQEQENGDSAGRRVHRL